MKISSWQNWGGAMCMWNRKERKHLFSRFGCIIFGDWVFFNESDWLIESSLF